MPGIYSGGLYAFMVSFADVPMSIFLTAPGFVTYPVELFYAMENDFDPVFSIILIGHCLLFGYALDRAKSSGLETCSDQAEEVQDDNLSTQRKRSRL